MNNELRGEYQLPHTDVIDDSPVLGPADGARFGAAAQVDATPPRPKPWERTYLTPT